MIGLFSFDAIRHLTSFSSLNRSTITGLCFSVHQSECDISVSTFNAQCQFSLGQICVWNDRVDVNRKGYRVCAISHFVAFFVKLNGIKSLRGQIDARWRESEFFLRRALCEQNVCVGHCIRDTEAREEFEWQRTPASLLRHCCHRCEHCWLLFGSNPISIMSMAHAIFRCTMYIVHSIWIYI